MTEAERMHYIQGGNPFSSLPPVSSFQKDGRPFDAALATRLSAQHAREQQQTTAQRLIDPLMDVVKALIKRGDFDVEGNRAFAQLEINSEDFSQALVTAIEGRGFDVSHRPVPGQRQYMTSLTISWPWYPPGPQPRQHLME